MIDEILEQVAHAGTLLELPGLAIHRVIDGPQTMFTVARNAGWSGAEIERELRRLHIGLCGRNFDADHLYFFVKRDQARWAEYVLRRAGVPVLTVIDERNAAWAEGKGAVPGWDARPARQKRAKQKRGLLARLWDELWG